MHGRRGTADWLDMLFLCSLTLLLLLASDASAFLYQPGSPSGKSFGEIWDPSITWWRGKWCVHRSMWSAILAIS